jgi:hypothetical protein
MKKRKSTAEAKKLPIKRIPLYKKGDLLSTLDRQYCVIIDTDEDMQEYKAITLTASRFDDIFGKTYELPVGEVVRQPFLQLEQHTCLFDFTGLSFGTNGGK